MQEIALAEPDITDEDITAVTEVLRSGRLSLGPQLDAFEEEFAAWTGSRHATAVSSGTAALHLAVRSLGIVEDDEVITSPFSFVASANCTLFERAKPRFVDIDPSTLTLNAELVETAISDHTRAILAVHIFGENSSISRLRELSERHRLLLIEDCCQSLGSRLQGRHLGTFGKIGVFSFYPNKVLTTGEGGVLITGNGELDRHLKKLRNQGRATMKGSLRYETLGYNYRLGEIQCALGRSQLRRIETMLQIRSDVARRYRDSLVDIEEIILPPEPAAATVKSWFTYTIRLRRADSGLRDRLLDYLQQNGVGCRAYFPPLHLQPHLQKLGYQQGNFPVTEQASASVLSLPLHTGLSRSDVDRVTSRLKQGLYELGLTKRG